MWVFLGFPVGGLEGWSGGPQTSPIGGVLGGLIDKVYNMGYSLTQAGTWWIDCSLGVIYKLFVGYFRGYFNHYFEGHFEDCLEDLFRM